MAKRAKRASKTGRDTARVLLRLPAHVHRAAVKAAMAEGVSFNELCVRRLCLLAHLGADSPVQALVVQRATAAFGEWLRGLLVMGSWARGELTTTSDIDVLIVIDSAIPLTRDLYREWDRTPLTFEGREIDVHVVHAPVDHEPPTALWCEAAIDGIVWYDPDGAINTRLQRVRRAIAEGRVIRRVSHGHPYWTGAA